MLNLKPVLRIKGEKLDAFAKTRGWKAAKKTMIEAIRQALYASKIISYAQGYTLMRTAAKTYGWNLNYGGIALMWRGGCIIRSVFLGKIKEAYDKIRSCRISCSTRILRRRWKNSSPRGARSQLRQFRMVCPRLQ